MNMIKNQIESLDHLLFLMNLHFAEIKLGVQSFYLLSSFPVYFSDNVRCFEFAIYISIVRQKQL